MLAQNLVATTTSRDTSKVNQCGEKLKCLLDTCYFFLGSKTLWFLHNLVFCLYDCLSVKILFLRNG